jgi:hypothetical protein
MQHPARQFTNHTVHTQPPRRWRGSLPRVTKENGMIAVIKVTDGSFNVIGTDDDMFIIQGNLTEAQLKELIKAAREALKEV